MPIIIRVSKTKKYKIKCDIMKGESEVYIKKHTHTRKRQNLRELIVSVVLYIKRIIVRERVVKWGKRKLKSTMEYR